MKGFPVAVVPCITAIALAPWLRWLGSVDSGADHLLAQLDLASVGGRLLSSRLPLWQFQHLMTPEEVDAVLSRLPDEDEFDSCNRTAVEFKTLAGRSCARLRAGDDPLIQAFLARVGMIFRVDMSRASHMSVVRYAPGSPGVPCHVDKYVDKSRNDVTLLVYLTTANHPGSGLTVFEKVGVSVRPESGTALAWSSGHINAEHSAGPVHFDEPRNRLVLQFGFNREDYGLGDSFELPRNVVSGSMLGGDYSPDCSSWCTVYTCSVWGCLDCPQTVHPCAKLQEGKYCAIWCGNATSALPWCLGCSSNSTAMAKLRGSNTTSFNEFKTDGGS
jgi:hypothetical protein